MGIQLRVNGPMGEDTIIDLCDSEKQMKKITVEQLKLKIKKILNIDEDIRIVYGDQPLEEFTVLSKYSIQHMSTIHTLLMLPGGY